MSAPRCLRIAIEACRPQKTSSIALRPRFQAHCSSSRTTQRTFLTTRPRPEKDNKASDGDETGPIDITSGFPMPEPDAITIIEPQVIEHSAEHREDSLKRDNQQPKHTMATVHKKEIKPDFKSEAQIEALQQISETSTPTMKSSPPVDVQPSSSTQRKPPRDSRKSSKSTASAVESLQASSNTALTSSSSESKDTPQAHVPPNVLAAYRTPLYHKPTHGIPVAQLQLRSFSTRNLEFFADFCVRAAYYLSLPCTGPTPLPKKTERWTVLKSNFVNKKAQENFERITLKRLITIYDGAPEVVETWLAFVRRWQFHGVGMKAHVWGWESTDVSAKMDRDFNNLEAELAEKLQLFGYNKHVAGERNIMSTLERQQFRREGMGMSEVRAKARPKGSTDPW